MANLCVSSLTDKFLKGFDEGLLNEMISINLQKAFDSENQEIWLNKRESLGFLGHYIRWFS